MLARFFVPDRRSGRAGLGTKPQMCGSVQRAD
jgi:hypothetical protein